MRCRLRWSERKGDRTQLQYTCDKGIANALLSGCTIMDYNAQPRNSGIGTLVYPLVEGELREAGCREVKLIRVNPRSVSFWRKQGYRIKGTEGSKRLL